VARLRVRRVALPYGAALLVVWTLGGALDLLDRAWGRRGVGFLVSAMLLAAAAQLPFALWRTFVVERRFGFNRTTPRLFALDLLKQAVLFVLLAVPLAWGALRVMDGFGRFWWVSAWAGWLLVSVLVVWLWPALVAPRFNRFTPLPDGDLRRRIRALVARCGFEDGGVYLMDGSRRSAHSNAYFTGLGRTKRVVLFDTLVETMTADEIEAVLAHELGHFKLRHLPKLVALSAGLSLFALGILAYLRERPWFFGSLGVRPSSHAALLLLLWVGPLFAWPLRPLGLGCSRRFEFQADAFAARTVGPAPLRSALEKLCLSNASYLDPDPIHSAFHDSHPPPLSRLGALAQ